VSVREQAIEAGARAYSEWLDTGNPDIKDRPWDEKVAAAVFDAVEPIIRADERAETIREEMALRRRVLLNLRAKVEELPAEGNGLIWRKQVLALLDEGLANG
jgi:hypothetical protein